MLKMTSLSSSLDTSELVEETSTTTILILLLYMYRDIHLGEYPFGENMPEISNIFFLTASEKLSQTILSEVGGEPQYNSDIYLWKKGFTYNQNTTAISTFGRLFSDGIHTDASDASDGSIGAHRAVLTASLPIFGLTGQLKEKDLYVIEIPEMSIKFYQPFLSYLYSNKIQNQDLLSHRLDLLRVADTYDMSDLKDVCQDILIEDIDSENVIERVQTAFRYHLPRLKICCIDYLVKFGKIFDIKDEFNAFIQSARQ
ncbi:BTB/POZ domain-containing protein [Tanacetum coccineum]